MVINDFSALIEFVATMSVAFVAVESVKSYTSIACDRLLGLSNFVEDAMNECRKMLVDKETISHIQPVVVDGRSTNTVIEESKRDLESLEKEIGRVEEDRKNDIIDVCQAQSLSSLCFFIFLFNIVLLFAGGLDSLFPNYIHSFVVVLCVCSILYFLWGWFYGEKDTNTKLCNFVSLWHPMICTLICVVISVVVCFVFNDWLMTNVVSCWYYFLMASILFSYLNFVVFVIVMRKKAKELKTKVNNDKVKLEGKCATLKKSVDDLMGTERISATLADDNSGKGQA